MKNQYDVIVVGGGPAGAATATHLARAGREVLLLERARFPRDKPCGEFFSPPVRGLLQDLGVYQAVLRAGTCSIPAARIHCADGKRFGGDYAASFARSSWAREGGLSLPRLVLDRLLFENARAHGADAREQAGVREVVRERGVVVGVHTDGGTFRAPLVVGADGGRSRVARAMNVVRPLPLGQKIALVAHYENVGLAPNQPVEMHVAPDGAVCGVGPGPNGTADVTLVVAPFRARAIAAHGPEAYFDFLLPVFPLVAARLGQARRTRLATCGTFGHTTTKPIADGALLVGDAATFIDPFTGEGVYFALRGAQMAAETILGALKQGDTSARALMPYARARKRELLPKYALCGLLQRIIHRPSLLSFLATRFDRRPALTEQLLGVTGDMDSPSRLFSPAYLLSLLSA